MTTKAVVDLLEEVIDGHKNPNSPDYNECDKEKCMWCEEAEKEVDFILNPSPVEPTEEMRQKVGSLIYRRLDKMGRLQVSCNTMAGIILEALQAAPAADAVMVNADAAKIAAKHLGEIESPSFSVRFAIEKFSEALQAAPAVDAVVVSKKDLITIVTHSLGEPADDKFYSARRRLENVLNLN